MKNKILQIILSPFSIIYWIIVFVRNLFFDIGIFHETKFNIPIINVGNITVGGTGKTPHVEYILRLFQTQYNIAVLSRGYGRNTKGYILAQDVDSPSTIGDEPFQLKSKFNDIHVAVCEKRVDGINQLQKDVEPSLIVLDDAFQHRYVKPSCNILLVDYNRPIWNDFVFPSGRMRESRKGKKRADIIIVTKTPKILTINERENIKQKLGVNTSQKLFFSITKYSNIEPLFSRELPDCTINKIAIAVTGIAQPTHFINYLNTIFIEVIHFKFPDHHVFREQEINDIVLSCKSNDNIMVVTTEKDAVRLKKWKQLSEIPVFFIPIKSEIYGGDCLFDDYLNELIE